MGAHPSYARHHTRSRRNQSVHNLLIFIVNYCPSPDTDLRGYASRPHAIHAVWSALLPMMDSGANAHCTSDEVSCTLESPHRGSSKNTALGGQHGSTKRIR